MKRVLLMAPNRNQFKSIHLSKKKVINIVKQSFARVLIIIARCVYFYAHPLPPPPSHHHHSFIHSYMYRLFLNVHQEQWEREKGKNMNQSMEVYGRCGNFNLKHASEIMNEYNKLCMHASNSLIMHQKFSHFLRLLANRI